MKRISNYRIPDKMKKYQFNDTIYNSPVDLTLSVIGGRWQGLIVWTLIEKPKRFSEIRVALETINDKMLSKTLKKLVEQGVVKRVAYKEVPPRVVYSITDLGRRFFPILVLMKKWGEEIGVFNQN